MLFWPIGIFLAAFAFLGVLGINSPSHTQIVASDPGLAAVCDSSNPSWKSDSLWVLKCDEYSKAVLTMRLEKTYQAAKQSMRIEG